MCYCQNIDFLALVQKVDTTLYYTNAFLNKCIISHINSSDFVYPLFTFITHDSIDIVKLNIFSKFHFLVFNMFRTYIGQ